TTTAPATSVATRVLRAVCASTQGFSGPAPKAANPMWSSQNERICLEERLHPILLAPSFARALGLAGLGAGLSQVGWFLTPVGAALVGLGATIAVAAVWRWERTRLVVTIGKLYVLHGTLRRRAAANSEELPQPAWGGGDCPHVCGGICFGDQGGIAPAVAEVSGGASGDCPRRSKRPRLASRVCVGCVTSWLQSPETPTSVGSV